MSTTSRLLLLLLWLAPNTPAARRRRGRAQSRNVKRVAGAASPRWLARSLVASLPTSRPPLACCTSSTAAPARQTDIGCGARQVLRMMGPPPKPYRAKLFMLHFGGQILLLPLLLLLLPFVVCCCCLALAACTIWAPAAVSSALLLPRQDDDDGDAKQTTKSSGVWVGGGGPIYPVGRVVHVVRPDGGHPAGSTRTATAA